MELKYIYELISLVLLIGVLVFAFSLPDRKEKKARKAMLNDLRKSDIVQTKNGIRGKIISVGEETVIVNVDPGKVNLEIAKWAITSVENKKG